MQTCIAGFGFRRHWCPLPSHQRRQRRSGQNRLGIRSRTWLYPRFAGWCRRSALLERHTQTSRSSRTKPRSRCLRLAAIRRWRAQSTALRTQNYRFLEYAAHLVMRHQRRYVRLPPLSAGTRAIRRPRRNRRWPHGLRHGNPYPPVLAQRQTGLD